MSYTYIITHRKYNYDKIYTVISDIVIVGSTILLELFVWLVNDKNLNYCQINILPKQFVNPKFKEIITEENFKSISKTKVFLGLFTAIIKTL